MIDITWKAAEVVETRQRVHKHFSINVTINKETHNLEIDIWFKEDLDGSNPKLDSIKVGNSTFEQGVGLDVGLNLNECLDHWLNENYDLTEAETRTEFDEIFSAVWDYIESRNLY